MIDSPLTDSFRILGTLPPQRGGLREGASLEPLQGLPSLGDPLRPPHPHLNPRSRASSPALWEAPSRPPPGAPHISPQGRRCASSPTSCPTVSLAHVPPLRRARAPAPGQSAPAFRPSLPSDWPVPASIRALSPTLRALLPSRSPPPTPADFKSPGSAFSFARARCGPWGTGERRRLPRVTRDASARLGSGFVLFLFCVPLSERR